MRSVIIAFKRVQYPHTGKRLAEHFIRAVKDMDSGILSSIWTVTVDNATNNTAMIRKMNRKLPSEIARLARAAFEENVPESPSATSAQQVVQLSCTAHVLQRAVKEGLAKCPLVDSAIGYFRDLTKKISESTKLTEALQPVCAGMLHEFITPKLDVVTRWTVHGSCWKVFSE
ncbi:hypothetical protein AM588_10008498 [Phytophthora nicotianae]|uniref:Uncharacterized protein n=1 Tax=Phytophthora nicotianae TaxID=4792 RepID=A0A0W8DMB4_PHYNI|nr:hypothetical protein AM588_10008498 [Phytophthora nicotianae]